MKKKGKGKKAAPEAPVTGFAAAMGMKPGVSYGKGKGKK